jgi:hypothetical protein
MLPIVCLTEAAFPIMIFHLHLDASCAQAQIQLPIMAGATYGRGRLFLCSQLQFLSSEIIDVADTKTLLQGCIQWVADSAIGRIGVLGFDRADAVSTSRALLDLDFNSEIIEIESIQHFTCLVIPTDADIGDGSSLMKYVDNGGGLAVFSRHLTIPASMPINHLLSEFGTSFTFCLLNGGATSYEILPVPASFTFVRNSNFVPLMSQFTALLKQSKIDIHVLDDLVTTLQYYLMVCDERFYEPLQEILAQAWDFLRRTEYAADGRFCPDLKQSIVVILLQDIYEKLPIRTIQAIEDHQIFPGPTGQVELMQFNVELPTQDPWVSTGLWLPAGTAATVMCHGDFANLAIQVGCHSESLFEQKGPWRRWPLIVSVFPFESATVEIASPFGGIVYLTQAMAETVSEQLTATFTFRNFCPYPRWLRDDPSVWEETCKIDVPWGEVDLGVLIFTLPTRILVRELDFARLEEMYSKICESVARVLCYSITRAYRIVFDVELLPDDKWAGYPAMLSVDDIEPIIFGVDNPSAELFKAVAGLGRMSIREDCFEPEIEIAIAAAAAALTLQQIYGAFDPLMSLGSDITTLFAQLWEIETSFEGLLTTVMARFQDLEFNIDGQTDNVWAIFVNDLCRAARRDFTAMLHVGHLEQVELDPELQGLAAFP